MASRRTRHRVPVALLVLATSLSLGDGGFINTTYASLPPFDASKNVNSAMQGECLPPQDLPAWTSKVLNEDGVMVDIVVGKTVLSNGSIASSNSMLLKDAENFQIYLQRGGTCGVTNQYIPGSMTGRDEIAIYASGTLDEAAQKTGGHAYPPLCDWNDASDHTKGQKCGKVVTSSWESGGEMIMRYSPDYKYSECGNGLFVPFFPGEMMWSNWFRATIYCIAMIYCFLGVSIIADKFMVAIEVITSKEIARKIKTPHGTITVTKVKFWNATLANLSLMALGSSAPEILLAVIEAVGELSMLETYAEQGPKDGLGPSCIVGSAAFNLLVISAVCVASVSSTEIRRIEQFYVYLWTAVFSVWAYVWLVLVLTVISPNVVEIWEAVATFMMFWLLLAVSFAQDQNCFMKRKGKSNVTPSDTYVIEGRNPHTGRRISTIIKVGMSVPDVYPDMQSGIANVVGQAGMDVKDCDPEDLANLAAAQMQEAQVHSALHYRIQGARMLTGGRRKNKMIDKKAVLAEIVRKRELKKKEAEEKLAKTLAAASKRTPGKGGGEEAKGEVVPLKPGAGPMSTAGAALISFGAATYEVFESEPTVDLHVYRTGNTSIACVVNYETSNGSALAGEDFVYTSGKLEFAPNETAMTIKVSIIDDNEYEPDENFFVTLRTPADAELGKCPVAEVTIINDDDPGNFSFTASSTAVAEACGKLELQVHRSNGVDGKVKVRWSTVDGTAKAGVNFVGVVDQEVEFLHQETTKTFVVAITNTQAVINDELFTVKFDIVGHGTEYVGATYGDHQSCDVTLTVDQEAATVMNQVNALVAGKLDGMAVGTSSWGQQFADAVTVVTEDGEAGVTMDYVMHFLTLGWKVIFAFTPPTDMGGGWPTFFVSLAFIGLLTGFVGDIASIFGCTIGLETIVTAITFVALGTSLPDTFASMAAAQQSPTADASVGNVTGSNSVNVFLGLGIPWMISSIYAYAGGYPYKVKAGSLSFTVIVFLCCAVVCLVMLSLRRFKACGGGELGGPAGLKWGTAIFFVSLWFVFISLSVWKVYANKAERELLLANAYLM